MMMMMMMIDDIYKVYSLSPKNQLQVHAIASELSIEFMKVKKVFDLRWVFSSFTALKAVWRNFPALYKHFCDCAEEQGRSTKEKSRFKGLASKLKSWLMLAELGMLKDAVRVLKTLSLYLQTDKSSVVDVFHYIVNAQQQLLAMKSKPGKSIDKLIKSFDKCGKYKDLEIKKNDSDENKFSSMKSQFLQALHDNLQQRFPSTDFLSAAQVLNPLFWPEDPVEKILYGEKEVAYLCKILRYKSELTVPVLLEFTIYKTTNVAKSNLTTLLQDLEVFPISTAACERGFSEMNLQHTEIRNRLDTENVSHLLMISLNGLPLEHWNPTKYVLTWFKQGHRGALDKATGIPKKPVVVTPSSLLFK